MPVPSPCNESCVVDEARSLCTGCWRTLDEIAAWAGSSDEQRLAVLGRVEIRRESLKDGAQRP
jgi:uncharacterized protein